MYIQNMYAYMFKKQTLTRKHGGWTDPFTRGFRPSDAPKKFEGANTTILWPTRWVWAAWSCVAETGSTRAGTGHSCCWCLRGSKVRWWRGWWRRSDRRRGRWAGGRVAGRCRRGWHWQCFPYSPIRATRPHWCIPFGRPIPHRVGKQGLRSPQGIVKSTKTKLDVHQFHLIVKLHKGRNYLTWIPLTLSLAWTTLEQRKNQRKNQRTHNIDDACTVDMLLNLTRRFCVTITGAKRCIHLGLSLRLSGSICYHKS